MSYFVYILRSSKDGKYYIGSTADVVPRLIFHNAGLQRSTKSRIPFVLIYQEEQPDKAAALKREKQIKNYKGGEAFKSLLRDVAPPLAGH
jgi:putative endonuclease